MLPKLACRSSFAPWVACLAVAAAVLAAPQASAQSYVVDAGNGPGTHFTSIATAVATVPDGSILDVRPGSYDLFTITGKGLTLVGGPGVLLSGVGTVFGGYGITGTMPNQTVIMRGFTFSNFSAAMAIQRCQGPVYLEEIRLGVTYCGCVYAPPTTYWATDCATVQMRDCDGWTASLLRSDCFFERCNLTGYGAVCGLGHCTTPAPAIYSSSSRVQLLDCNVQGGSGSGGWTYPVYNNRAGIEMQGGSLRLLGNTVVLAGTNSVAPAAPAILGTGELRLDPLVSIQSSFQPPISATIRSSVRAMPAVLGSSGRFGTSLSGRSEHPTGSAVYLFVGWPGSLFTWTGVEDPFGFDPTAYWLAGFGIPKAGSPVQATITLPSDPFVRGSQIVWQALSADAQGLQISNPAAVFVY